MKRSGLRARAAPRPASHRPLGNGLDEVPGRDAYEQQQGADDGRGAGDLNGLALRLRAENGVEQRTRADEVDALDSRHVDRHDALSFPELAELRELRVGGAGHDAVEG